MKIRLPWLPFQPLDTPLFQTNNLVSSRCSSIRGALFLFLLLLYCLPGQAANTIVSDSRLLGTIQLNGSSFEPSVSTDGTKVAFFSSALNLVPNDNNGCDDVFVRDTNTGAVTRASVSSSGVEANGHSSAPSISGDGTKVVFVSRATNLVSGDTNDAPDVFLHDLNTGLTTRLSVGKDGAQIYEYSYSPTISADGTKVAFNSLSSQLAQGDNNARVDVFVRDIATGINTLASVSTGGTQANKDCEESVLSADGTKVAFFSKASNLVENDNNYTDDIFVRDLTTGVTRCASVGANLVPSSSYSLYPSLSADGNRVAFVSASSLDGYDEGDFLHVYVHDMTTNATVRASSDSNGIQAYGGSSSPSLSGDGTKVVFTSSATNLVAGDTNGRSEVFLKDLTTGTTTRVGVSSNNVEGNSGSSVPVFSTDGTRVAFCSQATNLVDNDTNNYQDVFVRHLSIGVTTRASELAPVYVTLPSNGVSSSNPSSFSADKTKVVFESAASNLVTGDTNNASDVFLRDLTTGLTTRLSVSSNGTQADGASYRPCISADGTRVAFASDAQNLVPGDINPNRDIFVRDLIAGTTIGVSLSSAGLASDAGSDFPNLNRDGTRVAFCSQATNLVSDDTNGVQDVFVRDLNTGVTDRVNVDSNGAQANGHSANVAPSLSSDGAKVAFFSAASNLVDGDTNGANDIFVRDLGAGTTTRVSVASDGTQANNASSSPCLSGDGNKVAFQSTASNLVSDDTNSFQDVFVHDLGTGNTTRVSVNTRGIQGDRSSSSPSLNANGTIVAFNSSSTNLSSADRNGANDVFVRNLSTNITTCASTSTLFGLQYGTTGNPSLSEDGTKVAYSSQQTNLVLNDTNGLQDVFVSDIAYPSILSISDVAINEGNIDGTTDAVFTVTVSPARSASFIVSYKFTGSTADSSDYGENFPSDGIPDNGVTGGSSPYLAFKAGQTTGTLTLRIKGDRVVEPDETFNFKLLSPLSSGIELAKDTGYGTIINDDHAPVANPQSPEVLEDKGTLLTLDASDSDGDALTSQVTSKPTRGTLYDGTSVSAPAITSVPYTLTATGDAKNKLFFVPSAHTNGSDSFNIKTTDGINSSAVATVSLNILAVNDAPSFTKGGDQSALDNAGDQSVASWATALSAGPANETGQSLDFVVSNTNNALFAVQPTVSADGTLAYTPKIGASGTATVSVKIHDDGGTANGGVDTSAAQTFVISITKHNEAPNSITLSRSTIADNAVLNTLVGNLAGTDPDTGDVLSFSLPDDTPDNAAFTLSGAQLRTATTFNSGVKSSYLITVRVTDGGGLSFDKQFTITVTDATKPVVTISTPSVNQKIYTTNFIAGVVSGTASDNAGMTSVRVRLARKRGTTNYYWNGTDFITSQSLVLADLTGAGTPNATWNLGTKVPPLNKLDAGPYSIQVSAYDAAGNKSDYADRTFTLTQDAIAPTVAVTAPTANAKVLISDFVAGAAQGTASDDIVVAAVKVRLSHKEGTTTYYWNGVDFVTASSTVDADLTGTTNATWKLRTKVPSAQQLPAGAYALAVYATDAAGNKSATASVAFSLSTDFTAPSVTINTPTSNQIVNINALGAGSISGDADDNLGVASVKLKLQRSRSGVVTYWNGSAFTTTAALVDAPLTPTAGTAVGWQLAQAIPASQLDKGAYTLYATAYDAAGNLKTSASRVFNISGTASSTVAQLSLDSSASGS